MIEIRPTTSRDIAVVDDLLARSYPALLKADYPASVMVTALPIISRAQPDLVTCGTFYGAFEDETLLGVGGWTAASPGRAKEVEGRGHIRHFATDPQRIRQGIGRAIIVKCLADARRAGVSQMRCQATLTAVPFYASVGFTRLSNIDVPLRAGIVFPAVEMQCELRTI